MDHQQILRTDQMDAVETSVLQSVFCHLSSVFLTLKSKNNCELK